MTTPEISIDEEAEALRAVAEHFPNIDVVYMPTADSLPYRWEVQSIEPRQYLGTIDLTATEINQPHTERRIVLRREFLRILKDSGHDR